MIDLNNNLLTTLLGGALVTLGAVGVAQTVFMGRVDTDAIAPAGAASVEQAVVDRPDTGLLDVDDYRVITDHPLFFADRRLPAVQGDDAEAGDEEVEEEPLFAEIGELQLALTGIIIDPEMRIALITDQVSNETMVMSEGMALEGEQAHWSLESLSERIAKFVASDGREAELELEVYTSQLAAAGIQAGGRDGRQAQRGGRRGEQADGGADAEARARAEEVRRRVAERRAELRAEAERRRQQRQ